MEAGQYSAEILKNSDENRRLLLKEDKCDKYDYLAAVACGAVGGIIDILMVGSPSDTILGVWTDKQVNSTVMSFARTQGWKGNGIKNAIEYLEKKRSIAGQFQGYWVNYDQRTGVEVGQQFSMSPKNHHMKSLAHSPDIIGLFFSVLAQFTSTSTFIGNGKLVTIRTDTFELKGGNYISKIFCGIANWFGHLLSDVAGSSGSKRRGTRGMGIVIPFYELFGFCKSGSFQTQSGKMDMAELATRAFENGYDFRFGLAQTIPVIVTDLLISLIWCIRRHFQYGYSVDACIPSQKYADLRVMRLIGNAVLCLMDGIDAGVRSGGSTLAFFMRMNLIAWGKLAMLAIKEVCIRIGIKDMLQEEIEAFKRINEALLVYLQELKKIDMEAFRLETAQYNDVVYMVRTVKNEKELNGMLLTFYDKIDLKKPWEGDFNTFMNDKSTVLKFE